MARVEIFGYARSSCPTLEKQTCFAHSAINPAMFRTNRPPSRARQILVHWVLLVQPGDAK